METYLEPINRLLPIHQQVADFNPALHKLYPVAVVAEDQFFIYDHDARLARYQFVKTATVPMPIPAGVRAAFQLEDYDGRIACVVTPEVFDALEGYVTILHEFVHCYQYETCEQALKGKLDVARQAQEGGDYMWEIQHPFPYAGRAFIRAYTAFFDAVSGEDAPVIVDARRDLRTYLGLHDFEYMLWQEWKEGFARWVENNLQRKLGVAVNNKGLLPPFCRVTFYAGGAAWIDLLHRSKPALVEDLRGLFTRMSLPNLDN
jgi:hypothetical protein